MCLKYPFCPKIKDYPRISPPELRAELIDEQVKSMAQKIRRITKKKREYNAQWMTS